MNSPRPYQGVGYSRLSRKCPRDVKNSRHFRKPIILKLLNRLDIQKHAVCARMLPIKCITTAFQYITYPTWDKNKFEVNDIALIELNETVTFDEYTLPVCLPNGERVKTGVTCFAAGWGLTGMFYCRPIFF